MTASENYKPKNDLQKCMEDFSEIQKVFAHSFHFLLSLLFLGRTRRSLRMPSYR